MEILVFEGIHYTRVLSFNMNTLSITQLGYLTTRLYLATSVRVGAKAYFFGLNYLTNGYFLVMDLETLEEKVFDVGFSPFNDQPEAFYDGENIYILGGNEEEVSRGILQLNPDSHEWKLVPVNNFQLPDVAYHYNRAPAPIYVEKLGRINFFGGSIRNRFTGAVVFPKDVWYVDVNPVKGDKTD